MVTLMLCVSLWIVHIFAELVRDQFIAFICLTECKWHSKAYRIRSGKWVNWKYSVVVVCFFFGSFQSFLTLIQRSSNMWYFYDKMSWPNESYIFFHSFDCLHQGKENKFSTSQVICNEVMKPIAWVLFQFKYDNRLLSFD